MNSQSYYITPAKLLVNEMTVKRNFDRLYNSKVDPWNVKNTQQGYYQAIIRFLSKNISKKENALDIGCGEGHLTSKLSVFSKKITGIDLSKTAILRAKKNYLNIEFEQTEVRKMKYADTFDIVFCSEVLYYLTRKDTKKVLTNISHSLKKNGTVFFSAWCPGGKYFYPEEFTKIIGKQFALDVIEDYKDHRMIIAKKKGIDVIFTVDYETWQPIPRGYEINWDKDIIDPAETLMNISEKFGVPLTFMVETAEYLFLKKNQPQMAEKIELQIKKAVAHGHDIQLHIHPSWLPELGAKKTKKSYEWESKYYSLKNYPHDLNTLFKNHIAVLKKIVGKKHNIVGFRANNYLIQPNEKIFNAMKKNKILSDTSVWECGHNNIGFDFRGLNNNSQPYLASKTNVLLPALDEKNAILEIPILSIKGKRLTFNWTIFRKMANLFKKFEKNTCEGVLNIVGHTKGKIDYRAFECFLKFLHEKNVNFISYSDAIKKQKKHAEIINLCELQHIRRIGYETLPFGIKTALLIGADDSFSRKNILIRMNTSGLSFNIRKNTKPVECLYFCDPNGSLDFDIELIEKILEKNGYFSIILKKTKKNLAICKYIKKIYHDVKIRKIDSLKDLSSSFKYALLVMTGRKEKITSSSTERAKQIMHWTYAALSPEQKHESGNPEQILKEKHAWCEGYVLVMDYICKKEGIKTRKTTLFAKNHVRGRGSKKIETHEILEIKTKNGWVLFDPMTNVCFNTSLEKIIANPHSSDKICKSIQKDERWIKRKYNLYCTSYFYKRVFRVEKKSFVALPEFIKDIARATGVATIKKFVSGKNIK